MGRSALSFCVSLCVQPPSEACTRRAGLGRGRRDWYFVAERPAPAPHLAHPEGCAALRIVLVAVPRVCRSCEHVLDGFDFHLIHLTAGELAGGLNQARQRAGRDWQGHATSVTPPGSAERGTAGELTGGSCLCRKYCGVRGYCGAACEKSFMQNP